MILQAVFAYMCSSVCMYEHVCVILEVYLGGLSRRGKAIAGNLNATAKSVKNSCPVISPSARYSYTKHSHNINYTITKLFYYLCIHFLLSCC